MSEAMEPLTCQSCEGLSFLNVASLMIAGQCNGLDIPSLFSRDIGFKQDLPMLFRFLELIVEHQFASVIGYSVNQNVSLLRDDLFCVPLQRNSAFNRSGNTFNIFQRF